MTGFNIAEFKSAIGTGVLKTNKFMVQLFPPPILSGLSGNEASYDAQRKLRFFCEAASIPGLMLETASIKKYGIGTAEKRPLSPQFNDMTLTFISDKNGDNIKFFRDWMQLIVGYAPKPDVNIRNRYGNAVYETNYKSEYAAQVDILVYDDEGNEKITTTLYEAFPIFVSDIPLNWSGNDSYMKVSVALTFLGWDYVQQIQ